VNSNALMRIGKTAVAKHSGDEAVKELRINAMILRLLELETRSRKAGPVYPVFRAEALGCFYETLATVIGLAIKHRSTGSYPPT
jgi:hypothetical protein